MIRAEPLLREVLLRAGRAAAKARREPLRRISRLAYGDSGFFDRLRRNKTFTVEKYDQAMAWLADPANWPGGTVSPEVGDPLVGAREPEASR